MARVTGETVIDRLHYLEELVQQADDASLAVLASSEFGPMIQALLVVLGDHAPDARGRCQRCIPWWQLWRRRHPCRAWVLAHHQLVVAPASRATGPVLAVGGPR